MTSEQFRSWIHTAVEAWRTQFYPGLPTFYENGELPDQDNVGTQWLDVSISFLEAAEATVGSRPIVRDTGNVKLMVYTKQGEGTQAADQVIDSLRDYFRTNARTTGALLRAPARHSPPPALGWKKDGLIIPFKNDVL